MDCSPMIRLRYLLAAGVMLVACTHSAPPSSAVRADDRITLDGHRSPLPAGTRYAVQFNNEPAVIHAADGRGGPPILYHGQGIEADQLKSIRVLKTKEARERFGD